MRESKQAEHIDTADVAAEVTAEGAAENASDGAAEVATVGAFDGAVEGSVARKGPRKANAWIAAAITALFFAHACLGCIVLFMPGFPKNLEWVVWVGVFAIALHVALSIATTWTMFTDTVRPPSARKKGHQIKKWITGALLLLIVAAHAVPVAMGVPAPRYLAATALAAAAVILCIHVCTGVKSLTRDLDISSRARTPIRVISIVLCVVLCAALIVFVL